MTFCIAVESNIKTDECPLPKGKCYWQHRETKLCCYTEKDLTVEEFCDLVNAPIPSEEELEAFKKLLRSKL